MFDFLIWTYWYLWIPVLIGVALAAAWGCWLWRRHRSFHRSWSPELVEIEDREAWYPPLSSCLPLPSLPPPYTGGTPLGLPTLPPPYNEVTAKPNLYPVVMGYDEGMKGTSGFVMHYFRSLSHASTLDSLGSSVMCNMVNEANTIIPPPYSYNNSVDELSGVECARMDNMDVGSVVSLANHRTTSDISSLVAQSPCSPPRATSPTIELRELLDKIQQLPQLPNGQNTVLSCYQNRPQVLCVSNADGSTQQRPLSPGDIGSYRSRRTRGKLYMPLRGAPNSKSKAKRWLSRSAPTTPSGTIPMSILTGHCRRPSDGDSNSRQAVPLLSEQDEMEGNQTNCIPLLFEEEDNRHEHESSRDV